MKEHLACGCFPTGRHYPGIAHLLRALSRGTVAAFDPEAPWTDLPIACIDTETTGRDATLGDRVVELGIVVGQRGEIVRRLDWLVNPGIPIPDAAREVHGISDEDVKDAPSFAAIAPEIAEALGTAIPAAYNASFDRTFVSMELSRCGLAAEAVPACMRSDVTWLDPLVWARELQKYEKGKKLTDVAARLGVALENAHRATDDAEAALRVLWAFATDPRVPRAYGALVAEQDRLARAQESEYRNWRQRNPRT